MNVVSHGMGIGAVWLLLPLQASKWYGYAPRHSGTSSDVMLCIIRPCITFYDEKNESIAYVSWLFDPLTPTMPNHKPYSGSPLSPPILVYHLHQMSSEQ
jgi:hypothetical protein